ncbi:MAG: hypothetical protein CL867_04875 [Cytophagaceae bacterium]|nr:hypothetical protein [Cytophagaceae bacterium]
MFKSEFKNAYVNKTVFLLLFFVSSAALVSQNLQQSKVKDTTAILSFVDKIIIKANFDTQTDGYSLRSENDSDLRLIANNQYRLVLSLDYEFIGASIGFAPTFFSENNDNNVKGESTYQDYSFRFFLGNWTQELQYQRVEGFYVENTADFIPNWIEGEDLYIQFPDLKTIFWGGSTSYVLNPNFSLRNVVYNTEWQRKSAGSFIPTLRYGFTRFSGTLSNAKSYENSFDIGLAPEYYYTAVLHDNWFLSVYASPVFGIRFSKSGQSNTTKTENNTYYPLSLDGGIQLGYSSRKWIYGVNLKFETTWYNENSTTNIANDRLFAKLYFGYRFDPPKAVEKVFKRLN